MVISSGIILIKHRKLLLLKPKGLNNIGNYSIPKGIVNIGETFQDAAIRETFEEVGLIINQSDLGGEEFCIRYVNNGLETKRVYCFVARVNEDIPDIIPINQLQSSEVEYAAFFPKQEALQLLFWRFRHILFLLPDFL